MPSFHFVSQRIHSVFLTTKTSPHCILVNVWHHPLVPSLLNDNNPTVARGFVPLSDVSLLLPSQSSGELEKLQGADQGTEWEIVSSPLHQAR